MLGSCCHVDIRSVSKEYGTGTSAVSATLHYCGNNRGSGRKTDSHQPLGCFSLVGKSYFWILKFGFCQTYFVSHCDYPEPCALFIKHISLCFIKNSKRTFDFSPPVSCCYSAHFNFLYLFFTVISFKCPLISIFMEI